MKTKIKVIPATTPKPVAYRSLNSGHIYIPKAKEKGGGVYDASSGEFRPIDYSKVTIWSQYEPLYEGTVIEVTETVTKEIKL